MGPAAAGRIRTCRKWLVIIGCCIRPAALGGASGATAASNSRLIRFIELAGSWIDQQQVVMNGWVRCIRLVFSFFLCEWRQNREGT